ncbi:DUF1837 domain-containing protein [Flavobacteriales bacterium]|nr:DUF1837 domain-containing protein [Flavobacteriales bacterium]
MELSIPDSDFLNAFNQAGSYKLDEHNKNTVELFILKTSANEFDYEQLKMNLLDPMISYSLSRKVKEKYAAKHGTLAYKAKEKFIHYLNNKGEVGELILYSFLESHLKAPKILSKLELKTSTSHYVNGSDGVHYLKLENGDYHIIFGESKMIADLTSAITNAFKSIWEFKNEVNSKGEEKSGLPYEKGLISDQLERETFSEEEKSFIEKIIIPVKDNDFEVDHAFGVFIGYEIEISDEQMKLPNKDFRELIHDSIKKEIEGKFEHIKKKIDEYKLFGHNFYLYILPFTNIAESNQELTKGLTK